MKWWRVPFRKLQWVFAVIGLLLVGVPFIGIPLSLLFGFAPIVLIEIAVFDNTEDERKGYD